MLHLRHPLPSAGPGGWRPAASVGDALERTMRTLFVFKVVVTVCIAGYAAGMIWLRLHEARLTGDPDGPTTPTGHPVAPGGVTINESPAEGVAAFVHRLLFGASGDGVVVLVIKLWIVTVLLFLLLPIPLRTAMQLGGAAGGGGTAGRC